MATVDINTASEDKEWVLACNPFEQCEIESLKNDVSFIESEFEPTTETEQNNMHFLEFKPRIFSCDGVNSLWVYIDKNSKLRKRALIEKFSIRPQSEDRYFIYDNLDQIAEELIVYECVSINKVTTRDVDNNIISIISTENILVPCANSVGGSAGTEYIINNVWAINCSIFKE